MSLRTSTASVGEGCPNIAADVATVQCLLNCVPASDGGSIKELKVDGVAGVVTIEAINRFQKFHFGTSKSHLQSDEDTFKELKKYDPLQFSTPIVAPNLKPSISEKMDRSKMNRSLGKSIERGGVKGLPYGGVRDDSV